MTKSLDVLLLLLFQLILLATPSAAASFELVSWTTAVLKERGDSAYLQCSVTEERTTLYI